jgi:thymidylate kinase
MSRTVVGSAWAMPHPRISGVFDALDRSGIRWSLLRPPASLAQPEGDVDVLVEPAGLDRVRRLVAEHGFVVMPVGGLDVHAADYDPACDRFLWLHVQPELRLGGESVPARVVLADAVRDPLPRPSDPWLLWVLLLHGLLDKRAIAERHRPEVQRLARTAPDPPEPLAALAARRGLFCAIVAQLAAAGEWDRLQRLPIADAPGPSRRARLGDAADRMRRLWARRGIGVGVIGPDGAGKTTLLNGLRDTLPFPTRSLYMGLTGGRLPRADALRVPGVVLAARLAILWVRWGVGLHHRLCGRVVLFDRYTFDGTVPSGVEQRLPARVSRRLQATACRQPDLVLLLDASGATMHARKGEYDARRLEEWRAAYARLRGRVRRLEVLDAEQPADAVRRAALVGIWRCYTDRWMGEGA